MSTFPTIEKVMDVFQARAFTESEEQTKATPHDKTSACISGWVVKYCDDNVDYFGRKLNRIYLGGINTAILKIDSYFGEIISSEYDTVLESIIEENTDEEGVYHPPPDTISGEKIADMITSFLQENDTLWIEPYEIEIVN